MLLIWRITQVANPFLIQMIFSHFGFNLSFPTASLFCDILVPFGLNQTDFLSGRPIPDFNLVNEKFTEYIKYFLDISLQVRTRAESQASQFSLLVEFMGSLNERLKGAFTADSSFHGKQVVLYLIYVVL